MRANTERRLRRAVARRAGCEPGDAVESECAYCGVAINAVWFDAEPRFSVLGWWEDEGLPFDDHVAHLDHVIPECLNGPTSPDNTVLSCRPCNLAKGASPLGDPGFLGWLRQRRAEVTARGLVQPI